MGLKYVSYNQAKRIVRKLGITTSIQYEQLSEKKRRSLRIPNNPYASYRNYGWKDWWDFLGKEKPNFYNYKEARKIVWSKNLKTSLEWREWVASKKRDPHVPSDPYNYYKTKGWKNFRDWLGPTYQGYNVKRKSYTQARKFARWHKIKTMVEWRNLIEEKSLWYIYPKHPEHYFQGNGWINWNHFLQKGKWTVGTTLPYSEARKKVRKLNITTSRAYRKYVSENNSKGLHKYPDQHYKGWKNWADYLGN